MAEKRMFAKTIVLSDAFLDMPMSARCLYFTFGMLADDDGFVSSPKGIMRQCGASVDDLNILIAKRYVLAFDSGIIVIKHWRINNYLRQDRYTPTTYVEEKETLSVDAKGAYVESDKAQPGIPVGIPPGIPVVDHMVYPGKDSIEKDSIEKDSKGNISTEPQASPVLTIPLNDGSEYPITEEFYQEMQKLYPAVDVMQEFREMRAWSIANPDRKKTKRGVKAFINRWLSSEQDDATSKKRSPQKKQYTTAAEYQPPNASPIDPETLKKLTDKI